jgi:hypothetical protein
MVRKLRQLIALYIVLHVYRNEGHLSGYAWEMLSDVRYIYKNTGTSELCD